ncbi:MAG: hypothetical protein V4481_03805 [Patescibacteria group bacterium]
MLTGTETGTKTLDVLFIEDDEDMHLIWKLNLQPFPIRCTFATHAEEGLRAAGSREWAAVVADGQLMYGSTSLPVLDHFRKRGGARHLIGVSSNELLRLEQAKVCSHMADKIDVHHLLVKLLSLQPVATVIA